MGGRIRYTDVIAHDLRPGCCEPFLEMKKQSYVKAICYD